MPPRRSKGSGSLVERQPGVWRVRVYAGQDPITRQPRQVERVVRGPRRRAEETRRQLEGEIADGLHHTTKGTVGYLLDRWLEHGEKVAGRAPLTIQERRRTVENHLRPALGHIPLAKLTAADLDEYYASRVAVGLGPGTVRWHHRTISAALAQAVRWDWIVKNPALRASPPAAVPSSKRAPTPAQIRALVDVCADDPDLATAIILGAVTGARRGELCGLRWSDVDWDAGTLRIERQRVTVGGVDRTTGTKSGARTVALGPGGIAVLERYRQTTEVRASVLKTTVGDWLLSYSAGDMPMRPAALASSIRRAGEKAGVPVTAHLLRYFAATQMVGAGVDVRTAAARLAHDPKMLLGTYAGFMPQRDMEAARMLEALVLSPTEETPTPEGGRSAKSDPRT